MHVALLALVLTLAFVEPAYAYIDPNTGGYLFQLLFPVFAALIALWTFFRNKIGDFFRWMGSALNRLWGR